MDRLASLNAFVLSAECRSFTQAGRQLGISSSAVGKAISRLEERVRVRLFHRSTRCISLTPEGAAFLDRCLRIQAEMEAAESELAQANAAPCGRLRLSMPEAAMALIPAIADFATRYPEIELDIDMSDRRLDMIEDGFDVAIRTGDIGDCMLMTRSLGTFNYAVVGAPAYLERAGVPHRSEDLRDHTCLYLRSSTTGKAEPWPLRGIDGHAAEMAGGGIINAIEPLVLIAESGLGLICVPRFAVRRQLAAGTLRPVLDAQIDSGGCFRLLWPSSRMVPPKVKAFVDHLSRFGVAPVAPVTIAAAKLSLAA